MLSPSVSIAVDNNIQIKIITVDVIRSAMLIPPEWNESSCYYARFANS